MILILTNVPAQARSAERSPNSNSGGRSSPNVTASAPWGPSASQASTKTTPKVSNPDHEDRIKNVWSQPASEQRRHQASNSLMGLVEDLPPTLPVSMQDLKEEDSKGMDMQLQLDMDSPRFASIGPVRADPLEARGYDDMSPSHAAADPSRMSPYRPVPHLPNGTDYDFAMSSNSPSPHSAHGTLHYRNAPTTNSMNRLAGAAQHHGQPGVWMPLNQGGMLNNPGTSSGMNHYMGGSSGYNPAAGAMHKNGENNPL